MTTRCGVEGLLVEMLMPSLHCQIHGGSLIHLLSLPILFPLFFPIKLWIAIYSTPLFILLRPWWTKQGWLEVVSWRLLVELSLAVLFVFVAGVVKGGTGRWVLVLHGEIRLLLLVEFINGGEEAPLLSLADEVTPCCGVACAVASSTSWPVCQTEAL